MNILILQARLDSTRLPGKSLLPLDGEPLIFRVMEALNRVSPVDLRVLACPEDSEAAFAPLAARAGFTLLTGPKEDVLERYCAVLRRCLPPGPAREHLVIRATGDNPFVFADAASAIVEEARAQNADYAAYTGLPLGAGVEAVNAGALLQAGTEARDAAEREHVCPYLYHHPERFRLYQPPAPAPWRDPPQALRLTVDTPEDYERACRLYAALTRGQARYEGERIIKTCLESGEGGAFPNRNGTADAVSSVFFLVVPTIEQGRGGGHLVRSIELTRSLRRAGTEAWIFARAPIPGIEDLCAGEEELRARSWRLIILDCFHTPPEELDFWAAFAPVLGIDEGGKARDRFDFLIDLLPGITGSVPPNLHCPAFLPLPEKRRPSFYASAAAPRILITFGVEDAAGLTVPAALALAGTARVTVRFGPLNKAAGEKIPLEKTGVTVEEDSGMLNLRESLADYDLIVTHFGLCAFEALFARIPVALVSPTPYHEQLARNAGFVSTGTGRRGIRRLRSLLCVQGLLDGKKIRAVAEKSNAAAKRWGMDGKTRDLGAFLAAWQPYIYRACPVCGASPGQVLARFPDRTYRRCRDCGMVFMDRTGTPDQRYDASYFFEAYQEQYGKTYLEDFPALKEQGKRRLVIITNLLGNGPAGNAPRLLDAGCAYGPFLAAAKEAGFDGEGVDPCEEAVRHVRQKLGIPAYQGLFPAAFSDVKTKYRVITLWYVIEHLPALGEALITANRLLEPGGVLAFSTPSLSGVSRRVSLRGFLEKSPGDHWTIWEPRYCAGILARFGFRLRRKVITGHHPERFPLPGFLRRNGAALAFCGALSRMAGWGDTFEVYAVKDRECPEY